MTPSGTDGGPELLCSQSQEGPEAAKGLLAASGLTNLRLLWKEGGADLSVQPSLSQVQGNALVSGMIRAPEHFLRTPGVTQREEATYSDHPDPISPSQSTSWPVMYSSSVAWGIQDRLPSDGLVLSDPSLSLKGQGHRRERTAGLRQQEFYFLYC